MSDVAAVGPNPFTLLSLIAAPAVLTNAASLLVLSTSNRFARAVDRARSLSAQLASATAADPLTPTRLRQLHRTERRSIMLVRALQNYYLSIGSFAAASLISVLGAAAANSANGLVLRIAVYVSMLAGIVGVASLVLGCLVLVRETRLAVFTISEDSQTLTKQLGNDSQVG
jgi:hypothetical protein